MFYSAIAMVIRFLQVVYLNDTLRTTFIGEFGSWKYLNILSHTKKNLKELKFLY